MEENVKGISVPNEQVAATIRKYGAPVFSKPSGGNYTILYYPDTESDQKEEKFKDYAGEDTPTLGPVVVTHGPIAGSPEVGSTAVATSFSAGVSPRGTPLADTRDAFEDVEIEGEVDKEAMKEEKELREKIEEARAEAGVVEMPGAPAPRTAQVSAEPVEIKSLEPEKSKEAGEPAKGTSTAKISTVKKGK